MELRIIQQPATLGLDITYPKIKVEQSEAKMEMHPSSATFKLKMDSAKLAVDNTKALQAIGYYDFKTVGKRFAEVSSQKGLALIARMVEQGFQLADVHLKSSAVAEIAVANSWKKEQQVEVGFKPGPKVECILGKFEIIPEEGVVNINIRKGSFDVSAEMRNIEMYVLQKPKFDIEYVGQGLDIRG